MTHIHRFSFAKLPAEGQANTSHKSLPANLINLTQALFGGFDFNLQKERPAPRMIDVFGALKGFLPKSGQTRSSLVSSPLSFAKPLHVSILNKIVLGDHISNVI